MPINEQLRNFLRERPPFDALLATDQQRRQALDALIQADPDDLPAFRRAVIAHKALWQPVVPGTYAENDDFLVKPNLKEIREAAIARRVTMGLEKADESILLAILKDNDQELRDYLATKPDKFGKLTLERNGNHQPLTANDLSAAGLHNIKHRASELLLIKRIEKSNDLNALLALNAAQGANAIANIGRDRFGILNFTHVSDTLDINIKDLLKTRIEELAQKECMNKIAGMPWDDLNALEDVMRPEITPEQFKNRLHGRIPAEYLTDAGCEAVKSFLSFCLLKQTLLTQNITLGDNRDKSKHRRALENARNETERCAALKAIVGHDKPYIALAIAGRGELINETLYKRLYLGALESRLGSRWSPPLSEAFAALPLRKQSEILNNPQQQGVITHARDVRTLKHYFEGVSEPLLNAIVEENQRLAAINQIQNAEIARVLARFDIPIALSDDAIEAINDAINTRNPASFDNVGTYCDLVDTIFDESGLDPNLRGEFYKAFGLTDDGTNFAGNERTVIRGQHERRPVIENVAPEKYPPVLNWLRCQEYSFSLDGKKAIAAFATSDSAAEYIDKLVSLAPEGVNENEKAAFKARLQRELTSEVFLELKNHAQIAALGDDNTRPAAMEQIAERVVKIGENRQQIAERAEEFDFLNSIDASQFYRLSSEQQFANEMKPRCESLVNEAEILIDKLKRDRKILQDLLDSLASQPGDLDTLREKIEKEQRELNDCLESYIKIREKGVALLAAIDRKKAYVFQSPNVTRSVQLKSDEIKTRPFVAPRQGPGAVVEADFVLKNNDIPPGSVAVFDFVHKVDANNYHTTGRFTVEHTYSTVASNKNPQAIRTVSGGRFEVIRFPQLPAGANPKDPVLQQQLAQDRMEFAMALAAEIMARLDKAPTKDNPIGFAGADPEEMTYIWTALIIAGESNPKMKFGAEAIKLNSGVPGFNPKNDRLYEAFKQNSEVGKTRNAISLMVDEKHDTQKSRQEAYGQVREHTTKMKKGLRAIVEDAAERRRTDGPAAEQPAANPNPPHN